MGSYADVVIIGGGIAGGSVGFYLAQAGRRVVLVEAEPSLAYHTTGRSAALFFNNYGSPANRLLTQASQDFYNSPPEGLTDAPLLTPRGALYLARPDQTRLLQEEAGSGAGWHWLDAAGVSEMSPVLRENHFAAGLWEPEAADIDVAGLHQAFVRGMRRSGAEIRRSAPVTSLAKEKGGWKVSAGGEEITCEVVVNAAGAWGDVISARAGVPPVGLVPMRRTAFMVPGGQEWAHLPLMADIEMSWYCKPDGEQILCSLGEEKPSPPCDARPQESDVALALDRINAVTTLKIRTVRSSWTGLRSFVSDRDMVIGFDQQVAGFFWLVGQGGTGIQTAPGAGRLAASLITQGVPPPDLAEQGMTWETLSPQRLSKN